MNQKDDFKYKGRAVFCNVNPSKTDPPSNTSATKCVNGEISGKSYLEYYKDLPRKVTCATTQQIVDTSQEHVEGCPPRSKTDRSRAPP